MEFTDRVWFRTGRDATSVERDLNGDRGFVPGCTVFDPRGIVTILLIFRAGQDAIDTREVGTGNIFWPEVWIGDDGDQFSERFLAFLVSVRPKVLSEHK